MKTPEEELDTAKAVLEKMVSIINRLVGQHLTLEKAPLTLMERAAILNSTCPDLTVTEAKVMLSIAVAMLVEEREKKK